MNTGRSDRGNLIGKNVSIDYQTEKIKGKIVSHEEVEERLDHVLKSEPWYLRLSYKADRLLWKVYDYSRGLF